MSADATRSEITDTTTQGNRVQFALLVLGCWTVSALISTSIAFTFGSARQENQPVLPMLFTQLGVWWFWAAVTPAVWFMGRRFPIQAERRARAIAIHSVAAIVTALLFSSAHLLVVLILFYEAASKEPFWQLFTGFISSRFPLGVLLYFAVLGIGIAIESQRRLRAREVHAARLAELLSRAQVQALQTQLQPHFLFNTLHAVGLLVHEDPNVASRMLTRLGDLLRETLALTDVPEISLRDELRILDDYIGIERVRFGDRLTVDIDVDASLRDSRVPTFVLQPLVENAVRFGVTARVGPGRIRIAARRTANQLELTVEDEGSSTEMPVATHSSHHHHNGVGLASTRARLAALYPHQDASLQLTPQPNGGTIVRLTLPYRRTPESVPSDPVQQVCA
ncbi:MAG: sensor histidine kinase [Gemmatimonas sp.]